jgi:hypothetical protein
VTGWLRGEAFYQGKPTSYWSQAIWTWGNDSAAGTWLDQARVNLGFGRSAAVPRPAVLGTQVFVTTGGPYADPTALPVLVELLRDKNEFVKGQAAVAIFALVTTGEISEAEARHLIGEAYR